MSMPGESIYGKLFLRRASRWLTPLVARTPITPNGVTLLSIAVGVAGIVLLTGEELVAAAAGTALVLLWSLLDCLDGDLARYTDRKSLLGVYIDMLSHYIVNPGIASTLPLYVYLTGGDRRWLWASFLLFLLVQGQRLIHEVFQALCYQQIAVGASPRHYGSGAVGSSLIRDEFLAMRDEAFERGGRKRLVTQAVRFATDPVTLALGHVLVRGLASAWNAGAWMIGAYLAVLAALFAAKVAANLRIRIQLLRKWHNVGA